MAKKKTSVVLPGGIAGLVHQVQKGGGEPAQEENNKVAAENSEEPNQGETTAAQQDSSVADNAQPSASDAEQEQTATKKEIVSDREEGSKQTASAEQPATKRRRGRPAAPKMNETPTEKAEHEYHIVKDNGADSWELFLSLGRIYKTRDQKLATIYIDPDLKRILDRLKTASGVKLPTAAILSSIVARFIFDHEKKINDVIFGERLI